MRWVCHPVREVLYTRQAVATLAHTKCRWHAINGGRGRGRWDHRWFRLGTIHGIIDTVSSLSRSCVVSRLFPLTTSHGMHLLQLLLQQFNLLLLSINDLFLFLQWIPSTSNSLALKVILVVTNHKRLHPVLEL